MQTISPHTINGIDYEWFYFAAFFYCFLLHFTSYAKSSLEALRYGILSRINAVSIKTVCFLLHSLPWPWRVAHFFVRHTTGAKENGINQTKQNLSAWSNERNGMDSIRGPKQNQNHRRDMKTVIVKSFADDYDCDHLQSDEDINPP